jgi:hypothetical protein
MKVLLPPARSLEERMAPGAGRVRHYLAISKSTPRAQSS